MTAEQQLERSVLEGKEREELHAIAQAMSLKTTSRTKKADIIDRILEATGVTPAGADGNGNGHGAEARTEAANGNGAGGRRGRTAEAAEAGDAAQSASRGEASGEATAVTPTEPAPTEPAPTEAPAPGGSNGAGSSNGRGGSGHSQATHGQRQRTNNQAVNAEPGNRRGRRRRGRERGSGSGSGERELQGGGSQDAAYQGELVEVRGLLDLRDEGYGFVRCDGYLPSSRDVYVSISQARRFALRKGDHVEGACRPASSNEKYPALLRIDRVSGLDPEAARSRPRFEDLTPLFPDSKLALEMPGAKENVTARIVDLLSPIGKGQRGLIVSPPKAGKTTIMKQIAHSIEANNPDVHLMVLLVDERPEEVTDMRRSVNGEVVASTFDRPSDEHTAVSELAIERAKRLVEQGRDVVIILDGITRLARAYNLAQPATGRIMSGGVDSGALYPPKRFFGAARNIEEGGSLTILATALVETGSKMDEVIFEEFKGTGNMELRLDRRLAERRLYPSIDVNASSTRHEELLFDRGQLQQVWKLRRVLNALANEGNAAAGLELLMDKIRTTTSNDEFLAEIAKGPTPGN
ncbi:MAG: transcription termination factor Rho [Acidimicrobiales bacterium]